MEEITLTEHLGHDWTGYPVSFAHPVTADFAPGSRIAVRDLTTGALLPGQLCSDGRLWLVADLPAYGRTQWLPDKNAALPASDVRAVVTEKEYRLSSQFLTIAVPNVDSENASGLADVPAPLSWLMGPLGVRRGRGEWASTGPVVAVRSRLTATGPVFAEVVIEYGFADGTDYQIAWRVFSQAQVAVAEEDKTVREAGTWRFVLGEDFPVDTAHLAYGDGGHWPLDFTRGEHVCRHLFFNHWSLYQDFKDLSFVYDSQAGPDTDAVGIFPVNGDGWTHPGENIISLDATLERTAIYSFSLTPGVRSFAFFALTQRQTAQGVEDAPGAGAYALQARWSQARLEDVKAMTLDWPEPPRSCPWLYAAPERLAALTALVHADTDTYGDLSQTSALFSDDPQVVQAEKEQFFADAKRMTRHALSLAPNGAHVNVVMLRPLLHLSLGHEILQMRGALTKQEDRRARAMMAFLAYYTSREDYYFGRHALLPEGHSDNLMDLYRGMRSENMNVDRFAAIGIIGLAFPGHPRAAEWRQFALDQFHECMAQFVAPCGAWCEGSNYYRWSLNLLLHFAHVFRRHGIDLFAHPKFKAMLGFVFLSLSPRRPDRGGRRLTPGFGSYGEMLGDSGYGVLLAQAATAYQESDVEFSAHLMWAFHEFGEPPFGGLSASRRETMALFTDFRLPASAPTLTSQGCPGFGAIFRHTHQDGSETFLIARASPFWPHHHADPGSFFLYSRNAPLVTEAGHGRSDGGGRAHNILRFDGKDPMQYVWPCRQDLVCFVQTDALEYAVLDCRQEALIVPGGKRRGHGDERTLAVNIRHFRHIVFLKPDIFVVYDTVDNAPFSSEWRVWLDADDVQFSGNRTLALGRYHIDTEIVILEPAQPQFATSQIEDTRTVQVSNNAGGNYLVVLHPQVAGKDAQADCRWNDGVLTVSAGSQAMRLRFLPTEQYGVYHFAKD